jgi:hypothetical protein
MERKLKSQKKSGQFIDPGKLRKPWPSHRSKAFYSRNRGCHGSFPGFCVTGCGEKSRAMEDCDSARDSALDLRDFCLSPKVTHAMRGD